MLFLQTVLDCITLVVFGGNFPVFLDHFFDFCDFLMALCDVCRMGATHPDLSSSSKAALILFSLSVMVSTTLTDHELKPSLL